MILHRPHCAFTEASSPTPCVLGAGGSCWVHAVVAMLNDRLKILRRAAFPDVMLGRQVLINCAPKSVNGSGIVVGFNGCDGGDERDIYESLLNRSNWLPDETCQPYEALNHTCDAIHMCTNCIPNGDGTSNCFEVSSYVAYGISRWTQVTDPEMGQHQREAAMQKEILHHGPIVCNFAAISEFDENYTAVAALYGGVYRNLYANVTQDDINHDIVISGWGVSQQGVKYWIGRNSWGTFWGDNGWFRIERGVNSLLVEGACSSAVPTYDELEYALSGALGGGPTGLVEIELGKRWSHRPTHSDAPASFYAYEGAFVRSARLPAMTASVAPVMAAAFALALSVVAYAAGVAVTRRKVRRELKDARVGLRAAILHDDRM